MSNLSFRHTLPHQKQYTGKSRVMSRQEAKDLKDKWNAKINATCDSDNGDNGDDPSERAS